MERFYSFGSDGNDSNHWKGKAIIPLNDWIQLKGTPYALQYFPDDFDKFQTFLTDSELKDNNDQTKRWYSDYLGLMEYRRNPNYGRLKCFHCLLSPDGDDPIFIGINRLVAKGLEHDENKNNPIPYPCHVVNRFECPYEKGKPSDTKVDVNVLFELACMAFAVEIALAIARKETSGLWINNKEDLYQVLTNRKMFDMMLEQGHNYILSDKETFHESNRIELLQKENRNRIVEYFMNIKDKIKLEELRFY